MVTYCFLKADGDVKSDFVSGLTSYCKTVKNIVRDKNLFEGKF